MACRETERVQPALSVGQSPYHMRKSVGQAPTVERVNKRDKNTCRTSSDIGAEREDHNVGRGPT
jgi:hypothetical protein